jgi:hypothetical protein
MKVIRQTILAALVLVAPACLAQKWEIGGVSGGGFTNGLTVSNTIATATTGFANGFAFGAVLGQNLYPRVSGEIRYTYGFSDLHVSGAGQSATFKGLTHSVHYDIVVHAGSSRSRVRPFAAAGAGFRVFRGVGTESPYQPLSSLALLTKANQWLPMATFGGGIKYAIAPRVLLRVEVRDYFSRFPTKVIAPAPGAHLAGWLHDVVPMAGITFVF